MAIAPWRTLLSQALQTNQSLPFFRYVQLATVRPNGRPANRTVVFRGFDVDSNQLKFITDRRSQKIREIEYQPWAEICWYFPQSREQFRVSGKLRLIDETTSDFHEQALRQTTWVEISPQARQQFTWPELATDVTHPLGPELVVPEFDNPHPAFCVLLLKPTEVDHLDLKGEPHHRIHYRRETDDLWTTEPRNP